MREKHIDNAHGIFLMWWNWTVSTGLLISTVVLSLWIKTLYLPLAVFGLDLILFTLIRRNRQTHIPACYLIPFICSRALIWSAVIMVIINFVYSHWLIYRIFDPATINAKIPFITQLIVAPVSLATALWAFIKGGKLSTCRDCKMRYGTPAERGFLGQMFTQEGRYQNRLLIATTGICTVVSWGYYFMSYVNVNFNTSDKFFFVWMTVLFFVFTTVYTAFRYLGLWTYYCKKQENVNMQSAVMTKLRYIVVWDNFMCVSESDSDSDMLHDNDRRLDTPVQVNLPYHEEMKLHTAKEHFENITNLRGVDVRLVYSTLISNADCNIFHYICYLNDAQKEAFDKSYPDCHWLTLTEVAEMINKQEFNPLLSAEFVRIYTIAMAKKTYDPEGRRLYKIKHYRPTFRIRDLKNYDVDFNDTHWLYVADNNEDRRLWKWRKMWRKYVNGIG